MRVLVTGGAGFIGSYVVRELRAHGHAVTVYDSLISGARENVPEGVPLIKADIRDVDALRNAAEGADAFVHLAALVSVPESVAHPEATFAVNVEGTRGVFALARERGARLVYASSAAVYGDLPGLPKREDSPLAPQSPYAESKVENERDAAGNPHFIGLRFFNVYGVGQRADHPYASVIPRFIAAARRGAPLPLTGDGTATRDFVQVRDVARSVRLSIERDASGVCNIASGKEVALTELIELIRAQVPVEVERLPAREGDILHSVADIARARMVLNWEPSVRLADGIAEFFT